MRPKSATLTEQELEIMKIVWQRERATVRDVYEELLERRKIAYTTVMTMMKILAHKKYLRKSQEDRAYVYQPTKPKNQVIKGMVREFVNRVFNGSAEPLLVHLMEDRKLSGKDLEEISRMIREDRQHG
jgi:predicted transcriptional regulator